MTTYRYAKEDSTVIEAFRHNAAQANYLYINLELADILGWNSAILYARLYNHIYINAELIEQNNGWFYYTLPFMKKNTQFTKPTLLKYLSILEENGLLEVRTNRETGEKKYYRLYPFRVVDGDIRPIKKIWPQGGVKFVYSPEANSFTPPNEDESGKESNASSGVENPPKIYKNKKQNTKTPPTVGVEREKKVSKRRSIPKHKQTTKKQKTNGPSEREVQLSSLLINKIKKNFPGTISEKSTPLKVEQGALALYKLVKKHKFDYSLVKNTLLWALRDSFWKQQFRSVAALLTPSRNNGNLKFENMAIAYQQHSTSAEDKMYSALEQLVDDNYKAKDVQAVLDDIAWLQDRLEDLNKQLIPSKRFYWHGTDKFLSVVKWLFSLEKRILSCKNIKTWADLMVRYLEFLENRLQKDDIDTLHAGMFSSTGVLFTRFVEDLSEQWGAPILQEQQEREIKEMKRVMSNRRS